MKQSNKTRTRVKPISSLLCSANLVLLLISCNGIEPKLKECKSFEDCRKTYNEYAEISSSEKTELDSLYANRILEIIEIRQQKILSRNDGADSRLNSLNNLIEEYKDNKPAISNDYRIMMKLQQLSETVYSGNFNNELLTLSKVEECNNWLDRTMNNLRDNPFRNRLECVADSHYYVKTYLNLQQEGRNIIRSGAPADVVRDRLDGLVHQYRNKPFCISSNPSAKNEVENLIRGFYDNLDKAVEDNLWEMREDILRERLPDLFSDRKNFSERRKDILIRESDIVRDVRYPISEDESSRTEVVTVKVKFDYKKSGISSFFFGESGLCEGYGKWRIILNKKTNDFSFDIIENHYLDKSL